ncbi:MAG: hypothetical protein KKE05_04410 [Nanoarchaeota archaeon]|nr:hypothetical protein [Nanoarchaeota archaeon]
MEKLEINELRLKRDAFETRIYIKLVEQNKCSHCSSEIYWVSLPDTYIERDNIVKMFEFLINKIKKKLT